MSSDLGLTICGTNLLPLVPTIRSLQGAHNEEQSSERQLIRTEQPHTLTVGDIKLDGYVRDGSNSEELLNVSSPKKPEARSSWSEEDKELIRWQCGINFANGIKIYTRRPTNLAAATSTSGQSEATQTQQERLLLEELKDERAAVQIQLDNFVYPILHNPPARNYFRDLPAVLFNNPMRVHGKPHFSSRRYARRGARSPFPSLRCGTALKKSPWRIIVHYALVPTDQVLRQQDSTGRMFRCPAIGHLPPRIPPLGHAAGMIRSRTTGIPVGRRSSYLGFPSHHCERSLSTYGARFLFLNSGELVNSELAPEVVRALNRRSTSHFLPKLENPVNSECASDQVDVEMLDALHSRCTDDSEATDIDGTSRARIRSFRLIWAEHLSDTALAELPLQHLASLRVLVSRGMHIHIGTVDQNSNARPARTPPRHYPDLPREKTSGPS
ncbi:hypothetical protein B0H17DRAFT_1139892 [Mycena rosella]|uniref:Uncharacterized protein n=1 Tax=Mycena rosella TaxID=1033263 RepID=A0AAD7G831_MYCRO|nr:hypothetical protein B0H17DRAFT_1139892 [Mycena rosella]